MCVYAIDGKWSHDAHNVWSREALRSWLAFSCMFSLHHVYCLSLDSYPPALNTVSNFHQSFCERAGDYILAPILSCFWWQPLRSNSRWDSPCIQKQYSRHKLHNTKLSAIDVDLQRSAAPTRFGDKILEPGHVLMVPFGYMHRNSRAWGDDHSKFNPTRFLQTKKSNSINNPAYRSFGASENSCPGKALAIRQVLSSVAYLMHTYDICAPDTEGKRQFMPVALHSMPTIGTSVSQAGKDLVEQLTPRPSEPVHHIIETASHASTLKWCMEKIDCFWASTINRGFRSTWWRFASQISALSTFLRQGQFSHKNQNSPRLSR